MLLSGALLDGIAVAWITFGWMATLLITTVLLDFVSVLHALQMPGHGLFILHFGVAGDGGRYRRLSSGFISGMPLNCPLLVALSNMMGGKLKQF